MSELSKFIQIDSYGLCLHNKNLPSNLAGPSKMRDPEFLQILAGYKFVLAIENAVCPDYITEKLWKVLQVGSVPVYFGAPNIREWLPNELSAILVEDFTSAKDLAQYLKDLDQNQDEYLNYLRHKGAFINHVVILKVSRAKKWSKSSLKIA